MDDDVKLTYKKKKRQRRVRCIGAIVFVILVFVIGFLIGYFAKKSGSKERDKEPRERDMKKELEKRQDERMNFHKQFQSAVKEEQLEKSLMYFSAEPHIAGSPRQKVLAEELVRRWKDEYGFDKVEMPMYEALLSKPDMDKKTRVTLKYKNGSIIYQVKGEEQEGGSSMKDKDVVQPFLGYSPSGKASGELVYVNYGRVQDFEQLKDLSVNVTGKIAIMRYGKIFRGNKVANAANYGAIAAIIYSDPADYAQQGGEPENTYPNTAWLPASGVQRGSLFTMPGNGDPQTPGIAALKGMFRRSFNDSELPPIPAHPMGYGDAVHFLKRIKGNEVPADWKGSLDIMYRLGPGFDDSEIIVEVDVNNKLEVLPIYNVIGTIYGREEPDRYVLIGNHRDAWVYGAVDASTGTTVTTEIARVLGEMKNSGWRPRRTIKICSWGGEEYSLIGSTEWVEQHEKELTARAVVYLNADTIVSGKYVLVTSGSPLVKDTILEFSKTVMDPNAHDEKETIFDIMLERTPSKKDPSKPVVNNLGSGSDYAPFYQFIGVPAADFYYTFGYNNKSLFYPVYHTQHDTFNWTKEFVDPDFTFHKAATQLTGGLLLAFADMPLLPMSVTLYSEALNESLDTLKSSYKEKLQSHAKSLSFLEDAVKQFQEAAKSFTTARAKVQKKLDDFEVTSFEELRRINDQMFKMERAFIYSYGLPGRRLVRHVIFAPRNEVPADWKGSLDIMYRLGPGFDDSEIIVEVDVNNKLEVLPIYNVIGTIYGREEPDRYVLIGNHRDAWVYGAVDASTGTTVTTEIARVLGEMKNSGWRPRRTIKICSWGGEEYSLIGSTEWVEQHEKELTERAVIYLNADPIVSGKYVLVTSGSPLVKDTILEFSKTVMDPNAHDGKETIFDIMLERTPSKKDPSKPVVNNLGSGSDYAPFYQFIGVPAADFYYTFGYNNKSLFYPVYHTQHDTFNWTKKFVDPDFTFHKAATQLTGGLLLAFADMPLLPMSVTLYSEALNESLDTLKSSYKEKLRSHAKSLSFLEDAVKQFQEAAENFTTARAKVQKKLDDFEVTSFEELRRINDQMFKMERAFIYSYGLPGRRLVRHVIFAPSKYNLYSSSSFPGVSDILFKLDETGDEDEVDRQISIARQCILAAVDILTPYE